MANRISITEFMKTEDAAGRTPEIGNKGATEIDASDHAYFILDDSRVMLLSTRRYMPQ